MDTTYMPSSIRSKVSYGFIVPGEYENARCTVCASPSNAEIRADRLSTRSDQDFTIGNVSQYNSIFDVESTFDHDQNDTITSLGAESIGRSSNGSSLQPDTFPQSRATAVGVSKYTTTSDRESTPDKLQTLFRPDTSFQGQYGSSHSHLQEAISIGYDLNGAEQLGLVAEWEHPDPGFIGAEWRGRQPGTQLEVVGDLGDCTVQSTTAQSVAMQLHSAHDRSFNIHADQAQPVRLPIPRLRNRGSRSHAPKPYHCQHGDCQQVFARDGDRRRHQLTVHGYAQKFLSCRVCDYHTDRRDKFHEHLRRARHLQNEQTIREMLV